MKKSILALSLISFLAFSCSKKNADETATSSDSSATSKEVLTLPVIKDVAAYNIYGDTFQLEEIKEVPSVYTNLGDNDVKEVVLAGTINSTCQKKGCWVRLNVPGDTSKTVHVMFKDYGFFVPANTDMKGKIAVLKGKAYYDTTSVEDLRHFAHDEGLSEEEILKIKEPKVTMEFEASGIAIEKEEKQ